MSAIGRDLRCAIRNLWNTPKFFVATVLILSLAMAGATLTFSVVDGVFLRDLPVYSPAELIRIVTVTHNRPDVSEFPYRIYDRVSKTSRTLSVTFGQVDVETSLSNGNGSQPVRAQIVTGQYFSALGVKPLLGRVLSENDEWGTNGDLPVVLSYAFWESHFSGDLTAIGKSIHLGGRPARIAGVTRPRFNGTSIDSGPDVQVPFIAGQFLTAWGEKHHDPRRCCLWEIGGRLRKGVTLGQAQAETRVAIQSAYAAAFSEQKPLSKQDREWIERQQIELQRMGRGVSWLRKKLSTGLFAMLGAGLLFLFIGASTVAGLLLTRAASQEQQNAIRLAIGSTGRRLVQQWLIEGAVLGFAGGLGALLITIACLPFLNSLLPPMRDIMTRQMSADLHLSVDFRLLGFAFLLCCVTTMAVAIAPALHASHADLTTPLKSGNASRSHLVARSIILFFVVMVCTVVVANTGLMILTLQKLEKTSPGFRGDHVVTFTVDAGLAKYDLPHAHELLIRLRRAANDAPGVVKASVAVKPLLRGAGMRLGVVPIGGRRSANEQNNSDSNVVTPGYFETLRIRLVDGRTFEDRDLQVHKPIPVVVNRTFAQTFFPGSHALGRQLELAGETALTPRFEVVGVVADPKYRSLREAPFPQVFMPLQAPDDMSQSSFELVVRTAGEPKAIIPVMRKILSGIDPRLPFLEVHTLQEDEDNSLWAERVLTRLGLAFGGLSMALATIGLYGLLSQMLLERSREVSIRMALGAGPLEVMKTTVLRTLIVVGFAIAAGLLISVATAVLERSILYGISPWNPQALGLSVCAISVFAILASFVPEMRAARVDPSTVLRHSA